MKTALLFFIALGFLLAGKSSAQTPYAVHFAYEADGQWERLSLRNPELPRNAKQLKALVVIAPNAKNTRKYVLKNVQLLAKRGIGAPLPLAKIDQTPPATRPTFTFKELPATLKLFLKDAKGQEPFVYRAPIFVKIGDVQTEDGQPAPPEIQALAQQYFVFYLTDERPLRDRLHTLDDLAPIK